MIRIIIVDDHAIVREGIVSLLEKEPDLKVVGEAGDGSDAMEKIKKLKPDIVIMDISIPPGNGITLSQQIFENGYGGKILILTQHEKEEYLHSALKVGVSGYLLKYSIKQEVIDAVRTVARGGSYFSPSISKVLVQEYLQDGKKKEIKQDTVPLTGRETEVLRYLAEGFTSRQIAERMNVGVRTVEFHRANIIHKLGIHDVASLTRFAIKHGLVKV
jgi:two-component system response regulator NreC